VSSKTSRKPRATSNDTRFLRPYAESKELSHVEVMRRATYAQVLDAHVQKHSQLQKPYRTEDYQQQEYAFPAPIDILRPYLPEFEWPDIPGTTTTETEDIDDPMWGGPPGGVETRVCHKLTLSLEGTCEDGITIRGTNLLWDCGDSEVEWVIKEQAKGTMSERDRGCDEKGIAGAFIRFKDLVGNTSDEQVQFLIAAEQPAYDGSCDKERWFTVQCCDCDVEDDLSWDDDNSADEITTGHTVDLYVLDGCPPYNWSISGGSGFTFAENGLTEYTTGLKTVTLVASDSACGVANITVSDKCTDVAFGTVICTDGGEWGNFQALCGGGDAGSYFNLYIPQNPYSCGTLQDCPLEPGKRYWIHMTTDAKSDYWCVDECCATALEATADCGQALCDNEDVVCSSGHCRFPTNNVWPHRDWECVRIGRVSWVCP